MDLTLSNFRCYKSRTFHFPEGVILIDGPSGKGKSTILTAIKYALYGTTRSVTTFGERKTTVSLTYKDITVTRTSIPHRLVVKTTTAMYEDDAAQGVLNRMFGPQEQFEATSYMMQKGTENFFSLSGAQKLHLLEQLSLLGQQDIQMMKEAISRDLKDKRKQVEKLEHQVELLCSQVGSKPTFRKKVGFSNLNDVKDFIAFLTVSQGHWEDERVHCDQDLFRYSTLLVSQQEQRRKTDHLRSVVDLMRVERDRLFEETQSLVVSEEKVLLYQTYVKDHETHTIYLAARKTLDEERRYFDIWFEMEQRAYDRVQQEWESCQVLPQDIDVLVKIEHQHKQWENYVKHLLDVEEHKHRFQEWMDQEQNSYHRYQDEWKALTVDPSVLDTYERYMSDHETFLVAQQITKDLQQYQSTLGQWVEHQQELFQRSQQEWESLQVNDCELDLNQYYVDQHEIHESYQMAVRHLDQTKSTFDKWLQWETTKYQSLVEERNLLKFDATILASYLESETQHQQWEEVQRLTTVLHEKRVLYHSLVHHAQQKWEQEIQDLESQREVSSVSIEDIQQKIALLNKESSIWKRISELQQKRPGQEIDLQLETLKKNREIMERFLNNLESRKNIHSCPQCKTSLVIQSCKIQAGNLPPLTEADHKKEEEYRVKLPKVIEKYEKNYREWISREEDKKEIQILLTMVLEESEEECLRLLEHEVKQLQDEHVLQTTQSKLEQALKAKRKEQPESAYQAHYDEIDKLSVHLTSMNQGKESSIPLEELRRLRIEMESCQERWSKLQNVVDPVTTKDYIDHQTKIDTLQSKLDTMDKGYVSPLPLDKVKMTLMEMKSKRERQTLLKRMEDPLKSKDYLEKKRIVAEMEEKRTEALPGKVSPIPVDTLRQDIWDMKSKQERQSALKMMEDPRATSAYQERKQALDRMEDEMRSMDQGQKQEDIQEVVNLLLILKAKQARQQTIQRLPLPSSTSVFQEKKHVLDQLEQSCEAMDKGRESHLPIQEVRSNLDEWHHMRLQYHKCKSRLDAMNAEVEIKVKEWEDMHPDETDYQSLMESTKHHHQWVTERLEVPTRLLQEYVRYATEMEKYIKYRAMVLDIHEKKRTCAIFYSQLEQLELLFQNIIQAEGVCLEQFIRRINQKLKFYMDHFFPDGSMDMELSTKKENKTGKISNEICVHLTQNNHPTELKFMSGGEHDRASLAIMLSINELAHSPFLFLDESISSLDMGLSEEVLEVIKEKQTELKKTVLLISHQANTGFFDHVIKL